MQNNELSLTSMGQMVLEISLFKFKNLSQMDVTIYVGSQPHFHSNMFTDAILQDKFNSLQNFKQIKQKTAEILHFLFLMV